MAESSNPQSGKTLAMRVAELEDKLAQTRITEDDIKAYQKVAAAMAAGRAPSTGGAVAGQPGIAHQAAVPALCPQVCVIHPVFHCIIHPIFHCIIQQCIISPIIINDCTCGPCAQASTSAAAPTQKDFEKLCS